MSLKTESIKTSKAEKSKIEDWDEVFCSDRVYCEL